MDLVAAFVTMFFGMALLISFLLAAATLFIAIGTAGLIIRDRVEDFACEIKRERRKKMLRKAAGR